MNRLHQPALRLLFALALIAGMFYLADPTRVADVLKTADPTFLTLGIGTVFAMYLIRTLRWRTVLTITSRRLELWPLFLWTLAGSLLNFLLPTSIGGDIGRWYLVRTSGVSGAAAGLSLVLDRLLGSAAFVPLAGITLLGLDLPDDIRQRIPSVLPALVIAIGTLALLGWSWRWFTGEAGRKAIGKLCEKYFKTPISEVTNLSAKLGTAGAKPWLIALLQSLTAHLCFVMTEYSLARSVGISASLGQMSFLYLMAATAMLAPISPNGLGIREGLNLWFLTRLGNSAEAAVAYSVLSLAIRFASCLPSLLFVDIRRRRE